MNKKAVILVLSIIVLLLAVTYLLWSHKNVSQSKVAHNINTITIIKTGTSHGECLDIWYCNTKLVVNPENLIYAETSNDESTPDLKTEMAISSDQWNDLVSKLDIKSFNALPETIGCPDCNDGGAEWIEIYDGETMKKITFEERSLIPEIDSFLWELRKIREEMSSQFPKFRK